MALNQIFNQAASLTIYAVIKHKYISIISTEWPHLIGSVSASSLCDWKENACKPLSRQVLLRHFQHTSVFIQPWCAGKILQQSRAPALASPQHNLTTWMWESAREGEKRQKRKPLQVSAEAVVFGYYGNHQLVHFGEKDVEGREVEAEAKEMGESWMLVALCIAMFQCWERDRE